MAVLKVVLAVQVENDKQQLLKRQCEVLEAENQKLRERLTRVDRLAADSHNPTLSMGDSKAFKEVIPTHLTGTVSAVYARHAHFRHAKIQFSELPTSRDTLLTLVQLRTECESLRNEIREVESEHERQRVMLRREARQQMQEANKAKTALSEANTKVPATSPLPCPAQKTVCILQIRTVFDELLWWFSLV